MKKLFATSALLALLPISTYAITAVGTAKIQLVTPINIVNTADLDFGNVLTDGSGGTVTVNTAGTRSVGGGITEVAGTPQAGAFTVDATTGSIFNISATDGEVAGTDGLTLGSFTFNYDSVDVVDPLAVASTADSASLLVGATMTIDETVTTGTPITRSYVVEVLYN